MPKIALELSQLLACIHLPQEYVGLPDGKDFSIWGKGAGTERLLFLDRANQLGSSRIPELGWLFMRASNHDEPAVGGKRTEATSKPGIEVMLGTEPTE